MRCCVDPLSPPGTRGIHAVALRNFSQGRKVAVERPSTLPGEGQPCPRPFTDVTFFHLHVAGLLQQADLLGQHRVGHLDVIPDEAELRLPGRRQESCDRKTDGMTEEAVQPMARMAQRRPSSQARTSSGITPIAMVTPK